jgi:hypothetical protein
VGQAAALVPPPPPLLLLLLLVMVMAVLPLPLLRVSVLVPWVLLLMAMVVQSLQQHLSLLQGWLVDPQMQQGLCLVDHVRLLLSSVAPCCSCCALLVCLPVTVRWGAGVIGVGLQDAAAAPGANPGPALPSRQP